MEKENPNKGHRERLRHRFLTEGLQNFQPHNVLEMLLFYTYAQGDTNKVAHSLIDRFGSLNNVLDAPFDELCKVKGVGERSAVLIMFAAQLAKRYVIEQGEEKISFDSTEAFHRFVIGQFMGMKTEAAFMLCLNNAGELLQCCKVSLGTKYAVSLDNRTLLETALRHNATKIVLAHNHPSGLAAPSRNDVLRTESAAQLFSEVQILLLDHLIVSGNDCFSMANHSNFARIFVSKAFQFNRQIAADVK